MAENTSTIYHYDGSVGAGEKLFLPGSADMVVASDSILTFRYDDDDGYWNLIGLASGGVPSETLSLGSVNKEWSDESGYLIFTADGYEIAGVVGYADGSPAYGDSPGELRFKTTADGSGAPGTRWRITSAGHLLPMDDSTYDIGTSSARVQDIYAETVRFPATQAASSGINDLDDYEEGTWTPALKFGGNSVDMAYTLQEGWYTKVGRLVTVVARFLLSAKGSSTGNAQIQGLPFAMRSDGWHPISSAEYGGMVSTNVFGLAGAGSATAFYLIKSNGSSETEVLTHGNFTDSSFALFGATYHTET
jgi:hypothetical protein